MGRTEREILEDSSAPTREEPAIQRSLSLRRKASSVPATPSTPLQPHLGYASLPRSSQSDAGSTRTDAAGSTGTVLTFDNNSYGGPVDNVALLETVSEDQEATAHFKLRTQGIYTCLCCAYRGVDVIVRVCDWLPGLKESSIDHLNDYYFRDSFEHSSSESQLHENSFKGFEVSSHRSSRSPTPLGHTNVDGRLCLPQDNLTTPHATKLAHMPHKFNLLKAFIPSLAFVVIFVATLTVVMLETDCELFGSLRNLPEMISLRYQYYEPFKQYLRNKFTSKF